MTLKLKKMLLHARQNRISWTLYQTWRTLRRNQDRRSPTEDDATKEKYELRFLNGFLGMFNEYR